MTSTARRVELHVLHALDRLRLAWLRRRHPGLEVEPGASACFAHARIEMQSGARLRIRKGAVTDRIPGALHFSLGPGALVDVGEGAWLRTDVGAVHVIAFEGAHIEIGPKAFLNGCHLSAKRKLCVGRGASVGVGSRVFDSDQHALDDATPENVQPVSIGDHVWIASDATVLRGVTIGAHSVVAARSLVTRDVPDHTLVLGSPARAHRRVGDRANTP